MHATYFSHVDFLMELHDGKANPMTSHFHPYYEFYYMCNGEVDYLIDKNIYSVQEGDLVIIPANKLHKTIAKNSSSRKRILLYLGTNYLDLDSDLYSLPSSGILHLGSNSRIYNILLSLMDEFENEKNELMIKSLLYELMILISRYNTIETDAPAHANISNTIQKVLDYIHSEYTSNITLKSAADYVFLNESYLSRNFKKHTGFTFSEYLSKHRIQAAIHHLENSEKNVSDIATEVGFNSLNHFCKTFKNHIGCSPLKYRKQLMR